MARKLCLQLLSHFLQSSLYFFLPRSSRKNAHSLLRYFGIRGIGATSLSLPIANLLQKRRNAQKLTPLYGFGAILDAFFRYERLCFDGGILYRPSFKNRCLSLPGNKKAPYCYDAFVLLGRWSLVVSRVMRKFALVSGRNLLQGGGLTAPWLHYSSQPEARPPGRPEVPSRFMRKIDCRLRLSEVSRQ